MKPSSPDRAEAQQVPYAADSAAPQNARARIFFHVGLGKAASTWLQYAIFPRLQGLHYIQRTRYKRSPELIARHIAAGTDSPEPVLISREFDQQLERECTWFARQISPIHASPVQALIVLRRQDGWFASQYRRHIKNGSPLSFEQFIDVEQDQGLWKLSDGLFAPKLLFLEELFGRPPVVLFYEELRNEPLAWLRQMASALGAGLDENRLSLDRIHTSYSEKQLKLMRSASRVLFPNPIAHGKTSWLARRGRLLACYAVLGAGKLIPASQLPPEPLIAADDLKALEQYYAPDWLACRQYAAEHPPLML